MERVIDGVRHKFQHEHFDMLDYESIERHLAEMAEQGWIFKEFDGVLGWEYHQEEPQKIKYAVVYLPGAEDYGILNERQLELDEFCIKAGWERVTSSGSAQIYCSRLENPVPIETDQWSRMESLVKSRKKGLGLCLFNAVIWGANFALRFSMYADNPARLLSSYSELGMLVMVLFSCIWWGKELVLFLMWKKKLYSRLEAGDFYYNPDELYVMRDYSRPVVYMLLLLLVMILDSGYIAFAFTVIMILALAWSELPVIRKVISGHWSVSPERKKRLLRSYAVCLLCVVLIFAWIAANPDIAESIEDVNTESTFIASTEAGGIKSGISSIIYEKYEIKMEALYPYCLEKYMKSNMYGSYRDGYYQSLPETEATLWGVDEVCRLYAKDGTAAYRWVLIDENYFIGVHSDRIEITDEEKQILSEKLGLEK